MPYYGACLGFLDIQNISALLIVPSLDDAAMSSPTAENSDKLRRAYTAVLIQIARKLDKIQQDELRFYCSELIPTEDKGSLNILRSLEHIGKISLNDIHFLKEALCDIQRLDLVKLLTAFEIKRDLTILLDFYVGKRLAFNSDLHCVTSSAKATAEYLLTLMTEILSDRFDVSNVRSLVESSKKNMQQLLTDVEEEIDERSGLESPWSRLTMLVVIAGEVIVAAPASRSEERCRSEAMELSFAAAGKLSMKMIELGTWVSRRKC